MDDFGNWALLKCLGEGGFGRVFLWKNRLTKEEIATKHLKEQKNVGKDEILKIKQRWMQEYEWVRDLKTPFIVHGFELRDEDGRNFSKYLNGLHTQNFESLPVLFMEYCNGGDLRKYLRRIENINGLMETEVRDILHCLRHAIEYLHLKCRIEHRDLKPDNILIHQDGANRLYKLTDFGFARHCTEKTAYKSMVGTPQYFAPEIIMTGKYTNSVDYWSAGVIAFEVINGYRPFLPHKPLNKIIEAINNKPYECVAITEDHLQPDVYLNQLEIPSLNNMSNVFLKNINYWLRLTFDVNYKTRGRSQSFESKKENISSLQFYNILDAILNTRSITVFCCNSFQFFVYEIKLVEYNDQFFNSTLLEKILKDTDISRERIILLLPTGSGYPVKQLGRETRLVDIIGDTWKQTTDKPHLYVCGLQCEYNIPDVKITQRFRHFLNWDKNKLMPDYILTDFVRETHYLLSNEQRFLEAMLDGLREYSLEIEHQIFYFENHTQRFFEKFSEVCGSVKQFAYMLSAAENVHESKLSMNYDFFKLWQVKVREIQKKMHSIEMEIREKIRTRLSSVSRRIKEEVNNTIITDLKGKDIYKLQTFRRNISIKASNEDCIEMCCQYACDCLEFRSQLLSNCEILQARTNMTNIHIDFRAIRSIFQKVEQYINDFEHYLENETVSFHKQLLNLITQNKLSHKPHEIQSTLNITNGVGVVEKDTEKMSILHEIYNMNTKKLIEDAIQNLQLYNMDTD